MNEFIGYMRRLTVGKAVIRKQLTVGNQSIFAGTGSTWHVDSTASNCSDTNDGKSWSAPLATLDGAINKCAANNGDVILLAPKHAETWATTGVKFTADIAGVRIISLGQGADRATFTYTHVDATGTVSAASVSFENCVFVSGVDILVTFMTISGNDCALLGCETRDNASNKEVVDAVKVTGDRFTCIEHLHNGDIATGVHTARIFSLAGVDNAVFYKCKFLTKVTVGVINMITTACTNIIVEDCDFLVASTSDYSKNVVATIGGCTWAAKSCFDLEACNEFSGGDGVALAGDDISALAAAIVVVDGLMDVPTQNLATNATMNQVIGNKTDTTAGTSLYALALQALATIGTLVNTGGTASLGGILGDVKNVSVASQLMDGYKKTIIADGTTIPSNSQAAAGLLATATAGDILIEEIIWQRAADNLVGPTNYEFSTDNVAGLTGAAAPNGLTNLASMNAQKTGILSRDGSVKQVPFVLESTKKLYIHGDDAATSAGGSTNFYIKYKRLAAGATLA